MKERIKSLLRPVYHWIHSRLKRLQRTLAGRNPENLFEIPIIINNFNRITYLKCLIDSLSSRGYNNIYIIDNNSTYPPLLEYYETCPYQVFRLNKNVGYLSLWETGIYKKFHKGHFVYTDSDLVIVDNCPDNFMEHFYNIMKRFPNAQKVGFGLKIDDLPDCFSKKDEVIRWEKQFWEKEVCQGVFHAAIDTTFALYRPFVKGGANGYEGQYRIGEPYLMKHLPWYTDNSNTSAEDLYYIDHVKTSTHWTEKLKQ